MLGRNAADERPSGGLELALQAWMQATVKAFAALADDRPLAAAGLWLRAANEIARAPASEPLRGGITQQRPASPICSCRTRAMARPI
ncbi:MAG: hypothetical protein WDN31_18390 [Hyphomicrobium sp.]